MMRNHGPLVVGPTVAAAFDRLYYLEDTCQRQMLAMSAGRPLQWVADEVAASLASQVPVFDAYAEKHLTAIKRVLDREEPDYSR
jgi:ribulose-5-phosphate 4-epimerase/fuculose-1-phosphate aldolase